MKYIICLVLCLIVSSIIIGCGGDPIILTENLKVTELKATQTTVSIGDTTTIEAFVDYSGDATVLMYTWTASGGNVQGTGSQVTYKVPNTPGTYTVNLKVTDGAVSSGKTIEIVVSQQTTNVSLVLDQGTYWPAASAKDKLVYDVKITRIASKKVSLHFDITQDNDKFDAYLSIQIVQKIVLQEMLIGNEQPSTGIRTVRDIDISDIIIEPGNYVITFYIRPGDRAQKGWLLNEARIIGVEGSSDPQQ